MKPVPAEKPKTSIILNGNDRVHSLFVRTLDFLSSDITIRLFVQTMGQYSMSLWVEVNDKMQHGYRYERVCEEGKNFSADFEPQLTPKQMLEMGVFGGKYMTDCRNEFPSNWFENAKLSPEGKRADMNYYGVLAGKPLVYWKVKGWIYDNDPRGWFQWYCRYYSGRRIEGEDERQIKRWKQMHRHVAQLRKNCDPGDFFCRPRQRQALLQWAYFCD